MVSTFGAQTRQLFPHWELTLRDFAEIVLVTIDMFGLQMWRPLTHFAPNVETMNTLGLQMWKPMTHLGSQNGNH